MQRPNALIFPEPTCEDRFCRLLAPFFDTIYHYRAYDAGPADFRPEARCRVSVPVALGGDRDWLDRYINDIKTHAAEYYEGFLASLSDPATTGADELPWQIAAGLSRRTTPATGPDSHDDRERRTIFQALLVLRLAELLTEEEKSLNDGLAEIAEQQKRLIRALRGENVEEELREPFRNGPRPVTPLPGKLQAAALARAWGQLYLRDTNLPSSAVLTTRLRDGLDLLLEAHTAVCPECRPFSASFRLPVPGLDNAWTSSAETTEELRTARAMIAAAASTGTGESERLLAGISWAAERWNNTIGAADQPGGMTAVLTWHLLPGATPSALIGQLCKTRDKAPTGQSPPPATALTIIAHLDYL